MPDEIDEAVADFLEDPLGTFKSHGVPAAFRIITLSNLAEYIVHLRLKKAISVDEAGTVISSLLNIAMDKPISPYQDISSKDSGLGDHGIYLSHLNVILGAYKRATGDDRHASLNKRISEYLSERSLGDAYFHMPSYPEISLRWPADQSVTLCSLYLYDKNYSKDTSRLPISSWLEFMKKKGMSKKWNLPVSEVTRKAPYSKFPRGCALSWTVRYMASFAPDQAAEIWRQYKKHFLVNAGFAAGFREWPPDIERKSDDDSGPVVFGIGAAASGFGLVASKAVGDQETYSLLKSSREIVTLLGGKKIKKTQESILSRAILLNSETYIPWYGK